MRIWRCFPIGSGTAGTVIRYAAGSGPGRAGCGAKLPRLGRAFFDIELPKDETQSDWLQRPLTDAQAHYAAQDVTYLHPMGVQLQNRAMERNRLEWVLEEGARLRPGGKPPIAKFKTAYRLPPEQQRVLAGVVEWREVKRVNEIVPAAGY